MTARNRWKTASHQDRARLIFGMFWVSLALSHFALFPGGVGWTTLGFMAFIAFMLGQLLLVPASAWNPESSAQRVLVAIIGIGALANFVVAFWLLWP